MPGAGTTRGVPGVVLYWSSAAVGAFGLVWPLNRKKRLCLERAADTCRRRRAGFPGPPVASGTTPFHSVIEPSGSIVSSGGETDRRRDGATERTIGPPSLCSRRETELAP